MQPQTRVWLAIAVAAALSLAALQASAYLPLSLWTAIDSTDPVTLSRAQAYQFALSATAPFGGLPSDARLYMSGGTTMMQEAAGSHRMTYAFMWRPQTNALRFDGVDDMAMAEVVSVPRVTCLRADCSRYRVVYRPELQSFMRTWHPAWWRAWLQRRIRSAASFVPDPSYVKTSCPGGVDIAALRRVIGNSRNYLVSWSMNYAVVRPSSELRTAGTTFVRFSIAPIAQTHAGNAIASAAIASDAPPKTGRYRTVWLYVVNPWPWQRRRQRLLWLRFASDDLERTCKGAPALPHRRPAALSDNVLAFDELADDALYRATEEARRRTHNPPHLRDAELVAVTKIPGGAVVRTRHDDGGAIWSGTFTYDRRGALIRVEYQRL